jgi:DNA invertase Pin-like site-specific DNA recombinase
MDQPLTDLSHQRIGYARVSSVGQHLDSQLDALQQAGCAKVFTDTMTGSRMDRPGWDHLLEYVRPGDTVVVTELSRMTRSLLDLLETSKLLEARHVELVSLRENIDTTSVAGHCFLSIMGAIHQLERELRAERAAAGRASAKARGRTGGRPRTDVGKLENARILYEHSEKTAAQACAIAGVGRRTFFAYLTAHRSASG